MSEITCYGCGKIITSPYFELRRVSYGEHYDHEDVGPERNACNTACLRQAEKGKWQTWDEYLDEAEEQKRKAFWQIP